MTASLIVMYLDSSTARDNILVINVPDSKTHLSRKFVVYAQEKEYSTKLYVSLRLKRHGGWKSSAVNVTFIEFYITALRVINSHYGMLCDSVGLSTSKIVRESLLTNEVVDK
ncbi:hypothetical protein NQ315_000604 [Exocentrus adspersus]|uniref:Uncharacterized protein n=1 Tax=Exocentrus adspersus TaxID=1586481 RepID=A0AAV8VNA4_9CUCU|nr:hypothetical protein NQ315_000604 [Exocentrus adspersus]